MATWVPFSKVRNFAAVEKVYQRTGQFFRAVRTQVLTGTWARRMPPVTGLPRSDLDWQVDVTAIPGVRPLNSGGAKR
jgi:hypothetical protein